MEMILELFCNLLNSWPSAEQDLAKQLVDLRRTGQTVHAHNSGLRRVSPGNPGRFMSDPSHVDGKSKVFKATKTFYRL